MTWNYRIVNHGEWLGLHEVYYHDDGRPKMYTADPISFACETDEGAAGIIKSLKMALNDARQRPVMTLDDFKGGNQ